MANNICVESTNYTQKMITDNMLCAGYPGVGKKDSCQVSSYALIALFMIVVIVAMVVLKLWTILLIRTCF